MGGGYDRDELLARTDLPALLDELCGPATAPVAGARWRCPVPDHDDVHPSVTVQRRPARRRAVALLVAAVTAAPRSTPSTTSTTSATARRSRSSLAASACNPTNRESGAIRRPLPPRQRCRCTRSAIALRRGLRAAAVANRSDGRCSTTSVETRPRPRGPAGQPGRRRPRHQHSSAAPADSPRPGPAPCSRRSTATGAITYLQTRYLDPEPNRSKYGNPASRLGDNPRHGWTRPPAPPKQPVVICEGFPDAYTANSAGYEADRRARRRQRHPCPRRTPRASGSATGRSILALDGDDAGRHAAASISPRRLPGVASWWSSFPSRPGPTSTAGCTPPARSPELGPSLRPTPTPSIAAPAAGDPRTVKEETDEPPTADLLARLRRRGHRDRARRDHRHRTGDPRPAAVHTRRPGAARRRRRLPRRPSARAGRVRRRRSPAGYV